MNDGYAKLISKISSPWYKNVPLKNLTSFKIGGPCDLFIELKSEQDLKTCLTVCYSNDIPWFLLGNGSNLLVADEGFRGVVLKLGDNFDYIQPIRQTEFKLGAASLLPQVANRLTNKGYSGLEWAAMIPGSIGGIARSNAGAFSNDFCNLLRSVDGYKTNGDKIRYSKSQLKFGYRYSDLITQRVVVTSVNLSLSSDFNNTSKEKLKKLIQLRKQKQPHEPSAGSVFVNPPGYTAGELVDLCGLKGYKIGGAQISTKHANFIVNRDDAKAQDVLDLINIAQTQVKEKFGVELKLEVKVLGEIGGANYG
ncbi:UDP-N-acetylmuramate dehydrogenase [Natranaerobius trueperi]|uniref:UDP-N-acetylenolpyruvoylglucosamine reductase n=1 Tax=Natranaerobius trueperi TaxID=759412 RepID=A0A226BZB4_9FIRM|nr:UDP-N-acetylmuramate dehydrogenase [Natranaerobius trueperi]OWZ84132.1 UDP-N-acetylenolpyruvoylglucosamine reductase [Natranaerobius trueperi]